MDRFTDRGRLLAAMSFQFHENRQLIRRRKKFFLIAGGLALTTGVLFYLMF